MIVILVSAARTVSLPATRAAAQTSEPAMSNVGSSFMASSLVDAHKVFNHRNHRTRFDRQHPDDIGRHRGKLHVGTGYHLILAPPGCLCGSIASFARVVRHL